MADQQEHPYSEIDVEQAAKAIDEHKKVTIIKPTSLDFLKDKHNLILLGSAAFFIISLIFWITVVL
ncbi:MAG: hypothetical protein ACEQSA_01620 [Weeksellaceae bacterium]